MRKFVSVLGIVVVLFVAVAVGSAAQVSAQSARPTLEIDDRHVEMCRARTLDYLGRIRDAAIELERFKIEFPDRVNEYETRRRNLDRSINLTAESFAVRQKLAMMIVLAVIRGPDHLTPEQARDVLGCVLG